MATVKNFGLAGVSSDLQFGKGGGHFQYNTDHFEVLDSAAENYIETYGATPTGGSDANALTTKEYVDSVATGLDFKDSVHEATTANLDATYDNVDTSPAGLGATLTANTAGVFPALDNHYVNVVGTRILVKDQTDPIENGLYTITTAGSGEEVTEFTVTDASGFVTAASPATYFTFHDGTTSYYVWFNVTDGSPTDPAPGGTGIEINTLATTATAIQVRDAIIAAVNASAADTTAYFDEDTILWLVNDSTGVATDSTIGTTSFTIGTVIQGTASPTAWVLTRSTDADNSPGNEVSGGMFVFVEDGATLSNTGWVLSSPVGNASLGVDELLFTQFSASGVVSVTGTAGRITVTPSGTEYNVNISTSYVGQTSITTLGTIATGTWEGDTVDIAYGGTGQTSLDDIVDAGGARITLTNNTGVLIGGGANLTIDVNEGNLNLDNIGGFLGLTDQVTGVLPVANGGTGDATLTSNGILYGAGTSPVGVTAAGSEGQVLRAGSGGTPAFSTFTIPDTIAQYSVLVADTANTLTALSATDTSGDQLLQWNDTTNSFEFVLTSVVGGNKFQTVTADAGTDAVADTTTDTLTLAGGAGITSTGTAASDTITFDMDTTGLTALGAGLDATADLFFVDDGGTGSVIKTVTAQNIVDAATINIFTTVTADTGSEAVDSETDSINFGGAVGLKTAVVDNSGVADVTISLAMSEISAAAPISTDELLFIDGGADTPAKVTITSFVSTFLGDVLVDGDFTTNGLMVRTASGTYTNRTITASSAAAEEGITITDGDGVSGNPTIGVDIAGQTANGADLLAANRLLLWDGTNNVYITGQEIADGVMALADDDRIVSSVGNDQVVATDGSGIVISTDDGSSAREFFTFYGTTADNRKMLVSNTSSEVTFSAGDEAGYGASSTDNVDIRFVPGNNGEVIFGTSGTDATLSASDGTTGENFIILGGDGSSGAGGDITLTPGAGTTTDGMVCITDADSVEIMCFNGVSGTAVNYVELTNATTTNAPTFTATGTDTNIDLVFLPKGTGVLSVTGTTNYEDNVTDDDDIPNKAYVDAAVSGGTVSGATSSYKFTVDLATDGNTDPSSSTIPAGATVMRVYINVTAADATATLTVGTTSSGAAYAGTASNDPSATGLYVVDLFSGTVGDLRAVVAGTNGDGGASADIIVEYRNA